MTVVEGIWCWKDLLRNFVLGLSNYRVYVGNEIIL
jgi:hypothetical protein